MNIPTVSGNRRRSGRTTWGVLRAVVACITHAGSPIAIRDHHGTEAAHQRAAFMVHSILDILGIEHKYARTSSIITVQPMGKP